MFKRILVCTDASEYSKRALAAAIELAEKYQAEVELFHVVPSHFYDYSAIENTPRQEKKGLEIGHQILDLTLDGVDTSKVKFSKKISAGHPATAILEELRRDFDLVVMGTRGHGPIASAIVGSVTQRVLADAPCPVLVMK